MNPKFQSGNRVRHILFQIEYEVISVKQGQNQFFYDVRQDVNTLIEDVEENLLEKLTIELDAEKQ
jgi:hypothetical protein